MTESRPKINLRMPATHSVSFRIWCIWVCGALFYAYQFILRTSPGIMADDLMAAFSVQGFGLGVLTAFYYNAYAAMQIPVGILIDRFGTRRLMTVAVLICAFGSIIFGMADDVEGASFGRLLMGIGSAFAYVGTLKMATLWFPMDKMGRVVGLTMIFGTAGASLGGLPLGHLVTYLGWRESMFALGVLGISLSITFWLILRDHPRDLDKAPLTVAAPPEPTSLFAGLAAVLSHPQVWIIALYAGLMYVPLSAFADLWGTPFFVELYQIDRNVAASITSMIYIGVAFGSPIVTYLSDRFQNRTAFMKIGALITFLVYSIALYVPHIPLPVMYGLLLVAGFSFAAQILSFVLVTQNMTFSTIGVTLGLTNMIVMLSGVIFEPLVGKLLDFNNHRTVGLDSIPHYTIGDYRIALSVIPVSLILAFSLMFVVKDKMADQRA